MATSETRKHKPYSFCHYCGSQYGPEMAAFPKKCGSCNNKIYLNPLPVAVVIVPVDNGVMLIRRSIEPAKGQLAFPGGYIDHIESWQEGGAREVWEEAGLKLDPAQLKEFKILNGTGKILIFGVYGKTLTSKDLPPFENTGETLERIVVTEPVKLGFDLHQQVIEEYFRLKAENKI